MSSTLLDSHKKQYHSLECTSIKTFFTFEVDGALSKVSEGIFDDFPGALKTFFFFEEISFLFLFAPIIFLIFPVYL